MTDIITTSGLVATEPRITTTGEGLAITSFRLAASQRKYNRKTQSWEYADTNWYTVTGFRHLATNLGSSIAKGDRVLVAGRLRIRNWENGDRSGTVVEIDADSVGHDLNWGTAAFSRTVTSSGSNRQGEPAETQPEDPAASVPDGSGGQAETGSSFVPAQAPNVDANGWAVASGGGGAAASA